MSKVGRQRALIIKLAKEPWLHTAASLAHDYGVDESTLTRDLKHLTDNGFKFTADNSARLFIERSGCLEHEPLNEAVLRQIEVMKLIASSKNGKRENEIISSFNNNTENNLSDKTLQRTIKVLKQKNLIIQAGERYLINQEKVVPRLYLEDQEKILLLEALALAEGMAPLPEEAKSVSAQLKKLVASQSKARKKTVHVHGRSPVHDQATNYYCTKIENAARKHCKLKILYRKAQEPATERTLNPLGIVYYWVLDKWYVVALDHADTELIKTYSIDNILHCEETGESFVPPQEFDVRDYFKYSWGIYRGEEATAVKVRFFNYYSVSQRAREELAHRESCEFTECEDGFIMTDTVQGLEEFAVWLRSFGPGIEVVEPLELRDRVIAELKTTLTLYESGGA